MCPQGVPTKLGCMQHRQTDSYPDSDTAGTQCVGVRVCAHLCVFGWLVCEQGLCGFYCLETLFANPGALEFLIFLPTLSSSRTIAMSLPCPVVQCLRQAPSAQS